VFYEIFVRSFQDSDGDGIGDFRGLVERLDYLNDGDPETHEDLGVTALWLMPVFESPSYHGYDTTDYDSVESDYGTLEDFRLLLDEAHARGIRVILDLMVNHTSSQHPWFLEASDSPDSTMRDWYVWRDDDPGWRQPWGSGYGVWHPAGNSYYYGVFWSGMPDLNFANPDVRAEVIRIARQWLEFGVDGFRLDAARHLFANGPGALQNDQSETHEFWKQFAAAVREVRPDALLVGENWTDTPAIADYFGDPSLIAGGDELPMNFNFPLAAAMVRAADASDPLPVVSVLDEMGRFYPEDALDGTFLANHDMIRLATQLRGDRLRLELAASLLLTTPGTPFLYYGEEIGLRNGPGGRDEEKRTPMPWQPGRGAGFSPAAPWHPFPDSPDALNVRDQLDDPEALLAHYRELIDLRRRHVALRRGTARPLEAPSGVLAMSLESASERLLVVHNLGATPADAGPLLAGREAERLWTSAGGEPRGNGLPPLSSAVWRVSP
jgi:glycosidase